PDSEMIYQIITDSSSKPLQVVWNPVFYPGKHDSFSLLLIFYPAHISETFWLPDSEMIYQIITDSSSKPLQVVWNPVFYPGKHDS
ncbi:hypothetical protein, partial [Escherichia coli]|uniref:hypothetical protein n=1 Tax=Escherichia coli TaxID=562 RepID=UPI002022EB85